MNSTDVSLVVRSDASKPEKKPSMYCCRTGVRYASAVVEVPRATTRIMLIVSEEIEMCSNPISRATSATTLS